MNNDMVEENLFLLNSKQSELSRSNIQLPKILIPKYYSDPSLLLEFCNSFENAIGNNTELAKVEKFTYLKSLLPGPALSAISGV